MPWKKDEKTFTPPLVIDGIAWYHPSDAMLTAQGWTWVNPPAPEPPDMTAFNEACEQFREVCMAIGAAIGKSDFKGGFDEYADFLNSAYAQSDPAQASMLASMWSGANELCKYEGEKLGFDQPQWWYKCWEDTADEQ